LRAVGILPGGISAVRGAPGEGRRRRGLAHGDPLRFGRRVGEGGQGRSIGSFDAGHAGIAARLGGGLTRQVPEERNQDIMCCRPRQPPAKRRVLLACQRCTAETGDRWHSGHHG